MPFLGSKVGLGKSSVQLLFKCNWSFFVAFETLSTETGLQFIDFLWLYQCLKALPTGF